MATYNQSKNTYLFKFDMSENALNKLFEKKELSSLLEPGDKEKLRTWITNALPKNNVRFMLKIKWWFKSFFMGENDKEKLNIVQLRQAVDTANLISTKKEEIIKQLISEYPLNVIDKVEEISVIFKLLLFMGFLMAFFWISGIGEKIQGLTSQINAVDEPEMFQTLIGLTFQVVAFGAFLLAMVLLPWYKRKQYINNDVENRSQKFKENFLQTIPNQIMNLGIITMIFAIVGIIFFREDQLLDVAVYFKTRALIPFWPINDYTVYSDLKLFGFDFLKFLLVAGGLTEAAAFYLGFRFPEKFKADEAERELKLDEATVNKLITALKTGIKEAQQEASSETIKNGVLEALTNIAFQHKASENKQAK